MSTSNIKTECVRFDLYPPKKPTWYCVGFQCTLGTASEYKDTLVPLLDTNESRESVEARALQKLQKRIDAWGAQCIAEGCLSTIDVSKQDLQPGPSMPITPITSTTSIAAAGARVKTVTKKHGADDIPPDATSCHQM